MDNAGSDLNAIAIFGKVVERQSFRGAAAALAIPKSTVSLKVAQLEDQLGVRLLERTTRALRLTDSGTAYYRQIAPALDALREAQATVAALQARPAGVLRVAAPIEFGHEVLPVVLDDYARRYPDVEIQVALGDRHVDLIEEGFDLALRSGPLEDSSLIARNLPACHYRTYASPAYLRRRGEPRRPEQLRDHDCLLMAGHRAPSQWQFRRGGRTITIEVTGKIQVNSLLIVRALAAAGHGVARLPEHVGDAEPGLRRILDAAAPAPMAWHAVYPSARNMSPKVRAFLELIAHHLANHLRRTESRRARLS